MFHSFYNFAEFVSSDSELDWAIEQSIISRELVGSKSNFRLLTVVSVVSKKRVTVTGQLCRHTHSKTSQEAQTDT